MVRLSNFLLPSHSYNTRHLRLHQHWHGFVVIRDGMMGHLGSHSPAEFLLVSTVGLYLYSDKSRSVKSGNGPISLWGTMPAFTAEVRKSSHLSPVDPPLCSLSSSQASIQSSPTPLPLWPLPYTPLTSSHLLLPLDTGAPGSWAFRLRLGLNNYQPPDSQAFRLTLKQYHWFSWVSSLTPYPVDLGVCVCVCIWVCIHTEFLGSVSLENANGWLLMFF